MSTSQYLFGAAELAVIVAALGIGAFHVRALLVPAWTGALARLAEFILGLSALVVIAELLGVLKLLEEVPLVAVCALVGIGAALWARPRLPPGPPHQFPAVRSSTLMVIVSVIAAAIVVAHWSEASQESLDTGMYYQDTTWYHMSFSGRFAQSGEVGPLHFTDPLKLTAWYYPQNSELLHAVGMVTLDTDLLSPLINLGWLAISLLAAWCIGRPFAVSAVTVLGAAVILDSEMMVASQAGNAPNDVAGVFFLLAVIAFIVNGAATARAAPDLASAGHPTGEAPLPSDVPGFDPEATDEHPQTGVVEDVPVAGDPRVLAGIGTGPLFLAGLAAGLGIGTKITLLAALGALTIGIAYLGGRRHWWQALAWWLGGMLITAGFWYGRNLFYSLNPFPQIDKLGPLNLPGPDQGGFYPREAHSLSEYYNDPHIWKDWFFPVLENRLGPLWPVILGAAAFGLLFVLVKGGSRLMRVLAITGIVAGLAYVFTPLTASGGLGQPTGFDANLRYVAPALIMAFVLLPLVPSVRHRPWPWVLIGGFAVLILQGAFIADDVTGLTIPRSWDFGHHDESLILALLVVAVPAAIVAAGRAGVNRWALAGLGLFALRGHRRPRRDPARGLPRQPLRGGRGPAAGDRLPLDPGVEADPGVRQGHPRRADRGRRPGLGLRPVLLLRRRPLELRAVPRRGAAPRHLQADRELQEAAPCDQRGRLRLRGRNPADPARDQHPARAGLGRRGRRHHEGRAQRRPRGRLRGRRKARSLDVRGGRAHLPQGQGA